MPLSIKASIVTCLESWPTTSKSCCGNEAWHCLWATSSSFSLSPSLCAWGWPQLEVRACFCCGAKQPQAPAKQLPVLSLAAVCKMADLMRQRGAAGFGFSSGTSDYSHKLRCERFVPQRPFSPRWTPLKIPWGEQFLGPRPNTLLVPDSTLCPPTPLQFPSQMHHRYKVPPLLKQVTSSGWKPFEKAPQPCSKGDLEG